MDRMNKEEVKKGVKVRGGANGGSGHGEKCVCEVWP